MARTELHRLPSVERLVQRVEHDAGAGHVPRSLLVACVRTVVDTARAQMLNDHPVDISIEHLAAEVHHLVALRMALTLTRAVNATGVIIHTNLGRAPLSAKAQQAVIEAMAGYSTLEVDLHSGGRGSRHFHLDALLAELTGAEAGFAVNNNAAAVLLSLAALARGRDVIVSRGELVEIGGSFRLPEVMAHSGARLVEVGTTNRTYASDYERAITPTTGLLLKVHRSNFVIEGFVHEPAAGELVNLGQRHGVPVVYDLGSGALVDVRTRGLPYEPTVSEAVAAGFDVVTWSGDKLLGGPQAGLLVGKTQVIERLRAHPLARAVRIDKLDIAALAATIQSYRDPDEPWTTVPVLQMLAVTTDVLQARASRLREAAGTVLPNSWRLDVIATIAEVGGGALPGAQLPSFALAIHAPRSPDALDAALRSQRPPVFGRIADDVLLLDVRTLLVDDEPIVLDALKRLSAS